MICKICKKEKPTLTPRGRCEQCIALLFICKCGQAKEPGYAFCPNCVYDNKMRQSGKRQVQVNKINNFKRYPSNQNIESRKSDYVRSIHEDQIEYGRRMMQMEGA